MYSEYRYISRADFEAWVELVQGHIYRTPDYRQSEIGVDLYVGGVKAEAHVRAIKAVGGERFYARHDEWNMVRVNDSWGGVFSFFGKGARAVETYAAAREAWELLTGEEAYY